MSPLDSPSHSALPNNKPTTQKHHKTSKPPKRSPPIPCQPTKKSTRLAFAEPSPAMSLISSFLILTRGLRIRLMQPFHFHVKIPPPWADTSLIHFQGTANLKQPSKLHHPSIAYNSTSPSARSAETARTTLVVVVAQVLPPIGDDLKQLLVVTLVLSELPQTFDMTLVMIKQKTLEYNVQLVLKQSNQQSTTARHTNNMLSIMMMLRNFTVLSINSSQEHTFDY